MSGLPGGGDDLLPGSLLVARDVVEALVRGGVRELVVCPGSRSAPFVPVVAAAEQAGALSVRVVLDERSAAFMALGAARASLARGLRRPAAVLTTSGTAVANLHPAVAEADAAGVPLVVISADRPGELVGTGASQTTEQTRVFGACPRLVVDLSADVAAVMPPQARADGVGGQVARLLAAARGEVSADPGPAHLNLRLRPPLALPASQGADGPAHEALRAWAEGLVRRYGACGPAREEGVSTRGEDRVSSGASVSGWQCLGQGESGDRLPAGRGVVVVGDGAGDLGEMAQALAQQLDWPVLAEPTSGVRCAPTSIPRYAELMGCAAGAELVARTQVVLVVGHPSLSRPVSALLAGDGVRVEVLTQSPRWTDVSGAAGAHGRVTVLRRRGEAGALQVGELVDVLRSRLAVSPSPAGWRAAWETAVAQLPADVGAGLSAARAALAVWESCRGQEAPWLVVGSSMSVRELDRWASVEPPEPRAVANRGLAGIDGTLATAVGLWWASGRPVRAVVGDLTFLHDAMSLARGRAEEEPDVQVVVLDDGGGAIFSTLEYPAVTPSAQMTRYFTTPQCADVPALAKALGADVTEVGGLEELEQVLAGEVNGLSVVYVRLV